MYQDSPTPPAQAYSASPLVDELRRKFPTADELRAAVSQVPTTTDKAWRQKQGPRYRFEVSPGSFRITATDYAKASKADARAADVRLRQTADMLANTTELEQIEGSSPKRGATSLDWSRKSRARMPLRFATLDYSKLFDQGDLACMVTLTYPTDFERLAPTPKVFKAHVNRLRARYQGTWGGRTQAWAGIWKMEFQRRGAPHLHIGSTLPQGKQSAPLSQTDREHLAQCSDADCPVDAHTGRFDFRGWLARHWSDIVFKGVELPTPWSLEGWEVERGKHQRAGTGVDVDYGAKFSDPKRVGIYFAKHGLWDKEYQNHAPEVWRTANDGGAGFWGYWVVKPLIVSKETHESLIMPIMSNRSLTMCETCT